MMMVVLVLVLVVLVLVLVLVLMMMMMMMIYLLEVGTFGVYFVPTSMSKYVLPARYGVKVVAALLAWCGKKIMLVCQSSFFGISVSTCEKGLRGCLAATTPCGRCC